MQSNHSPFSSYIGLADGINLDHGARTLTAEEERAVVIQMGLGDILIPEQDTTAMAQYPDHGPQPMQVAQSLPMGPSSTPCHYAGQPCRGFTPDELSLGVSGVRQHLWQRHHDNLVCDGSGKCVCQWMAGTDEECSQTITDLENLARHVSSVHLRLTAQKCSTCGAQFSRMDALLRHRKKCS